MRDGHSDLHTEPESVLPSQLAAGARTDADLSGARALMLAVLTDAIRCLQGRVQGSASNAQRLATEARRWVSSNDGRWLFSFVSVCQGLGFDAHAMRRRLAADPNPSVIPRRLAGRAGRHGPHEPMR